MKKYYLFYFVLATLSSFAQCPAGSVSLSTQAEVNAFPTTYPNCTQINGNFYISGANITDLTPLNQITSVSGEMAVYLCASILNLNGLQNLISVGSLTVNGNALINDITSLQSINTVNSTISVSNCPQLLSLNGLQGITTTGGSCFINGLPITSLDGLNNLSVLGNLLSITNCPNLLNLTALSNLNSISGYLELRNLPLLNNISGLADLNPAALTAISLQFCPNLTMCSITSFCTFLTTIGSGTFADNGTGCNGGEVVAGCALATTQFTEAPFKLFPNPASSTIHLELNVASPTITISDLNGKIVYFSPALQSKDIAVESLAPGVYIIDAATKENHYRTKFIKK